MEELDDVKHKMLWIPEGFAHGFLALEEDTIFCYQVTAKYHPEAESGIVWNDSTLNIGWEIDNPIVSAKDANLPRFDPNAKYF